ncbi:hypothetical protein F5Y08DRAFT_311196 [Xylaria arbuscula]|nr:hypothetical protein F5Y08DRAFT_311196 [Xylaria arbuscula]
MAHLTNYIAFVDPETGLDRIGHLDENENTIQPLSFLSGMPVRNLYQVIEAGSPAKLTTAAAPSIPRSSVQILPPISGRDVLAVGKNYMEHAREFNSSGYDSSDVVDRPSHPVIFTKRATSIIAHGEEILLHEDFTSTADYEGEIGVIIGKPGFRIEEEKAWEYVWGYTIINDVTAREKQRDHKQFFLGKSADTYCPMGPIAAPKESLPHVLRVQTSVNGEPRQDATTEDLIFSIPQLLAVITQGQTLQPGDVLATGTPAGVGIGKQPPVFLKPGDEISISITGLGTLQNKVSARGLSRGGIASSRARATASAFTWNHGHATSSTGTAVLISVNGKMTSYQQIARKRPSLSQSPDPKSGSNSNSHIIFIHGLGGTKESWTPLITTLSLASQHTLHLYDLEGHGLSPTDPLSEVTISSLASDLAGIYHHQVSGSIPSTSVDDDPEPVTLIAHSIGCLIASRFAQDNPHLVRRVILLNPTVGPALDDKTLSRLQARAAFARTKGMASIVDSILTEEFPPLPTNAIPWPQPPCV